MPKDAHVAVPRWRWIGAVGLVVLVVAGGLAWFLTRDHAKPAQSAAASVPPPAVGVRPVATKGVSQSFEFVGRIKATDKVELRARVEGFLEKVLFREGQDVKTGDLLYQIEKAQFEAAVEQAKGNLAIAEAELVNAQRQYDRAVDLAKRQFSPQSQVDQDKAALDTAKGKIMQLKAALKQAELNLDYTDIRAPIDGRIGRTAFTVGNLVNPSSGVLATIVSQDPIYVLFPVSVRDLEAIREARRKDGGGMAKIDIRVRLLSGKSYAQRGAWNLPPARLDPHTETLIMRANMPTPEHTLTDG